ncbi:hypothetical protein PINS_up018803 [Pythium insidiosum]|nr:hypothetical protein PINS_up018803 [Pythium insidiosum]
MPATTDKLPLLPPSPVKRSSAPRSGCCHGCRDELWAAKLMYVAFAAGQSALFNFLPVFYQHTAQFSKLQISVLQAVPCVCSMLAPPLWGAIADQLHRHRAVHVLCIVTGALLLYGVQFCRRFDLTVLLVALGNFQTAPSGSLLDHAVLDLISKIGGEYGKQRLFGAVGYGAGAYVTGLIVAAAGVAAAFDVSLVLSLSSLLVLRQIPAMEFYEEERQDQFEATSTLEQGGDNPKAMRRVPSFSQGVRLLCQQRDVLVLLVVVFLMGLMFGVLSSFLTLNLYNLSHGDANVIGIAIMCETASELPAFFFSQQIIHRLGTVNVLLVSIAGYALRLTFYAFMTNAWTAIPFEFLHGVTFGLAWAACTQYIYASAPRGCEGTVMGLLNAVQSGLGRGAGTLIGGFFYEHYGARTMWLVADLGVPLSLAGVAAFAWLKDQSDEVEMEIDSEIFESAELFSPHIAAPQPLYTPRQGDHHVQRSMEYTSVN